MILALHLAAINGHPFSIHALGAKDSEIVCAIGPALVRPQDWMIPEGSPRAHRQCCKWGLTLPALLVAVLQMAENASVFVASDMAATDAMIRDWFKITGLNERRMDAWTRPGPERVDVSKILPSLPTIPSDAANVLCAYRIAIETGAVAA